TLDPPKGDRPFALLDVAGGTGDISFRAAKAAGTGFHATVCDINTEMLAAVPADVMRDSILPQIPVGRLGEPQDIARAVVFLAADEAG
ncbi:SDR family oxidoreductase, partial [Escherichia coli]|nr:SDR family oxidoreductase [Escherichia coli]